jgi:hypothetical protein
MITHPEHGNLTVSETRTPGKRSFVCTREDGTTVELSSKAINKLTGKTAVRETQLVPEFIVSSLRDVLNAMPDNGVERLQVAQEIWLMLDKEFLNVPA